MAPEDTVVLFSHGFGIRKENLGLFTYIRENLEDHGFTTELFDYYKYNEQTKEIFTIPFSEQATILEQKIQYVHNQYPHQKIAIVAHSQGCIIPALCRDIAPVSAMIGLSPFFLTDQKKVYERYAARAKSVTDFTSESKRAHSDGTTTVIYPSYWTERFSVDMYLRFNLLAQKLPLTLVYGTKDSVMADVDLEQLYGMNIIKTDSDHDFTGEYREVAEKIVETVLLTLVT